MITGVSGKRGRGEVATSDTSHFQSPPPILLQRLELAPRERGAKVIQSREGGCGAREPDPDGQKPGTRACGVRPGSSYRVRMSFHPPSRSIGGSRHCLLHTAMTWCKWLQRVDDTAKGEAGRVLHATSKW